MTPSKPPLFAGQHNSAISEVESRTSPVTYLEGDGRRLAEILLVEELSAARVNKLLHRSQGWAERHVTELGGYRDGRQFRFPLWGIRAYQQRQNEQCS